jgi:peptidyl-prolyl cis-trans isomerase B (cyclophilin B)
MRQKPTGSSIANEADNGLLNANGTVAMARTQDPHSASAQFFINTQDNDFLNHKAKTPEGWGYCVFGRVSAGMDVVTAIEECATTVRAGHRDVPEQDVIIERAQVLED